MSNTLTQVNVTQLTTSFATIYTVPGATTFTVTMMHFVNATASDVTVQVCVVPNGGSPQQSNAILWNFTIKANDVVELLKGDIWPASATLQALAASNTAINIKLAGIQTA